MKKLVKELYIRDNCHPFKASLVAWFQMPLWLSVSFALRNMSGKVPFAGVGELNFILLYPIQLKVNFDLSKFMIYISLSGKLIDIDNF